MGLNEKLDKIDELKKKKEEIEAYFFWENLAIKTGTKLEQNNFTIQSNTKRFDLSGNDAKIVCGLVDGFLKEKLKRIESELEGLLK